MFITVHTATGIIVGQYTGNIWLAFIVGFISHFLLDIVPHGDNDLVTDDPSRFGKTEKLKMAAWGIGDILVTTTMLSILYGQSLIIFTLPVIHGIAGSILPDFITGLRIFISHHLVKKYVAFHWHLHKILNNFAVSFPVGIIIQLSVLILALFVAI